MHHSDHEELEGKPPSSLPLFILLVLVSLPPLANMWPSPALENIAQTFQISLGSSSLMISIFVLGYAISQLVYGPLANTIGRKRSLQIGFALGLTGALISVLATTYFVMLLGRFVMAFGVGAGLTLILTMIGDVYSHRFPAKGLQVSAFCFAAIVTFPGIGALISSQAFMHLGWRTDFVLLCIYVLFALFLLFRLPETLPVSNRTPFHIKQILADYLVTLKQRELYPFILLWGLANFLLYTLYTSLPLIITVQLHESPSLFGVMYLCLSIGLLVSNLVNSIISKKFSVKGLGAIGIGFVALGSLCFLWVSFSESPEPWHVFLAVLVIFLGLPILMSTGSASTIQRASNKSVGSSLASFIAMLCAFFGSAVFGFLREPFLSKEVVLALLSSVCFIVLLVFIFQVIPSLNTEENDK